MTDLDAGPRRAPATDASRAAEAWARRAGVRVELVKDEAAARQAVEVLGRVWEQAEGSGPLPPELAWALAHSGNYVANLLAGTEVVGAAVAFRGRDEAGALLHSHIVGLLPAWQGTGAGFALKQHQRAWALDQGLDRMTWTFDPLVSRNAYFNVMKLGAHLTRYYVNFYGALDDGLNAGDDSDRCLVTWRLSEPGTVKAAAGEGVGVDAEALAAGAVGVLEIDAEGEPQARPAGGAGLRLVSLPGDIVELRRRDIGTARRWRRALRAALLEAFDASLEVTAVTRDGRYLLSPAGWQPAY